MGLGIGASACGLCHACACVFVCIFVHRLWVLVSVLQRVDCVMHAHVFPCAYVFMCICMRICMCVGINICAFFCSVCYMHVTGVLGTSAWAVVYVTQVWFYTNVHICEHTRCRLCTYVYMYIYVCAHAYAYGCVCASMILLDTLRCGC